MDDEKKLDGEIPRKDMTINENDTTPAANSRCSASTGSVAFREHPVKMEHTCRREDGKTIVTMTMIPLGHPDYDKSEGLEDRILIPLQNIENGGA